MAKTSVTRMRKLLDLTSRKCSKPCDVSPGHFGAFYHVIYATFWLKTRSTYFRTGVMHVLAKFPHSVGVKRQWCGHRGKVDNCQVGVFMGYVSAHDHALLDFRLSLPEEWARDAQRRAECHVPSEVRYYTRHEQCLEMLDAWGKQVPHGWVTGDDEFGRH